MTGSAEPGDAQLDHESGHVSGLGGAASWNGGGWKPLSVVGSVLALVSIPLVQFGLVAIVAAVVSAVGVVRARRLGGEGRVRAWVGVGLGLVAAAAAILRYRWITG